MPPAFGASVGGAEAGAAGVEEPLPPNENPVLGASVFVAAGSAGLGAAGAEPKEANENPPLFGASAGAWLSAKSIC